MFGYSKDQPPHDEQGFTEFVASLEVNDVYEVCSISGLTPRFARKDITVLGCLALSTASCQPVIELVNVWSA